MEDPDCDSTWDEDEEEDGEGPRAEAGEDGETGAPGNAEAEEDARPSALQVPPPRPGNPTPLGRPRRQRGQSPAAGRPFPAPPRGQVCRHLLETRLGVRLPISSGCPLPALSS